MLKIEEIVQRCIDDNSELHPDLLAILNEHVTGNALLLIAEDLTGLDNSDITDEFETMMYEAYESYDIPSEILHYAYSGFMADEIAVNEAFSNFIDSHDSLLEIQKANYTYKG